MPFSFGILSSSLLLIESLVTTPDMTKFSVLNDGLLNAKLMFNLLEIQYNKNNYV